MAKQMNPFILSGSIPAAYFCDRKEESDQLQKALQNQMNVVLTSSRRMGKTSLVEFVMGKPEIQEQYLVVSVDILHTTTLREFVFALGTAVFEKVATRNEKMMQLFTTTLRSLSASFGFDPFTNMPTFDVKLGDIARPEYTLKEVMQYLEQAERYCFVVIDEFQQITKYPEKNVEALLRSYIQKMGNATFVFAGSQRRLMEEMFFSSKRPFYQSAKSIRLEPIDQEVYRAFAMHHFQERGKVLLPEAFDEVYGVFEGVTFYVQRIMKDAFAETSEGETCDKAMVQELVENFIAENDSRLREQLAFITEPQKELLYAIHEEGGVASISSAAFTKRHRLKSPSSSQNAALKLLEYDLITRKERVYSIADPLMKLWMGRKNL